MLEFRMEGKDQREGNKIEQGSQYKKSQEDLDCFIMIMTMHTL